MDTLSKLVFYNDMLLIGSTCPVPFAKSVDICHALRSVRWAFDHGDLSKIVSCAKVACEECGGSGFTENGSDCFECSNGWHMVGDIGFKGPLKYLDSILANDNRYPQLSKIIKSTLKDCLEDGVPCCDFNAVFDALFNLSILRAVQEHRNSLNVACTKEVA
jgi:hypothetical protein